MVGIPTRSVACLTCRRRKKRCDKVAPTCGNCKRSGIKCDGYTETYVWVHQTGEEKDSKRSVPQQQDLTPQQAPSESQQPPPRSSSQDAADSVALPAPLTRSAREQLFLGLFGSEMFPCGRAYSIEAGKLSSVNWSRYIAPLYDSEAALRYATVAISSSIIGRQQGDRQLRLKGIQAYNLAVVTMAKALQQPDWYLRNGLLVAARVMANFELLFVSDDRPKAIAWTGHNEGQQAMFLSRGPKAFQTDPAHALFTDCRVNMAMLAIGRRRRSPFSSPAWKTIPWKLREKPPKDTIIDIMLEIPRILEGVDRYKITELEGPRLWLEREVLSRCREVDESLQQWAQELGPDIIRFDHFASPSPPKRPENDKEYALLHLSLVYWFNRMMVFSILSYFLSQNRNQDTGSTTSPASSTSGSASEETESIDAARQTAMYASRSAHAIAFLFERDAGLFQNSSGLMALSISLRYFSNPGAICTFGNESKILGDLCTENVIGVPIGQLIDGRRRGALPAMPPPYTGPLPRGRILEWF